MHESLLSPADSMRVTRVLAELKSSGLKFAVTGGLAIAARLREVGVSVRRKPLSDLDIVVEGWGDLPDRLADRYLLNHIHPLAPEGKLLLQLVSPEQRLRIDIFRQYGLTVSRASSPPSVTDFQFVSAEDLRARATAHVCSSLGRGFVIDRKHVQAFCALQAVGEPQRLIEAWRDHHETLDGTIQEATATAQRLIEASPHLIVTEQYGLEIVPCDKCMPNDRFPLADRAVIASILGYV